MSNAATGDNLQGAVIELQAASLRTATQRDGSYRIRDLAPGTYQVTVSYTGLQSKTETLTMTENSALRRDFALTAEIYQLERFTVAGQREGDALAITLQRQSTGIKNIVSTDAFGDQGGNPAELLIRLPGVAGETVEGEIQSVRIRGMSETLNTITVDGNRTADAGSAGFTREYQFQTLNADAIERIEVVKSPTPDMDGDSIGGAVNMVTKSAFDRSGSRSLTGTISSIWRRPANVRDDPFINFGFSYSEVFKGRVGVALNYGYRTDEFPLENSTQGYNLQSHPAPVTSFLITDSRQRKTRKGGGLKLEYKLDDAVRFYLSVTHNESELSTNVLTQNWSAPVAGILPGWNETTTAWNSGTNNLANLRSRIGHKLGESYHIQVGGVHRYHGVDLDYDVYESNSSTLYTGNKDVTITARGVAMRFERGPDPYRPTVTQTAGPDLSLIESYSQNTYNILNRGRTSDDNYRGGAINFRKEVTLPAPSFLKMGLRSREQSRRLTNAQVNSNYVGPDGVMGVNPATRLSDDDLARFVIPRPENILHGGRYRFDRLPFLVYPGRDKAGSAPATGLNIDTVFNTNPEYFVRNYSAELLPELRGRRNFRERITAGYLMGGVDLGALDITGGARVELTDVWGEGNRQQITDEERNRRAAWVGPVTTAELIRRTVAEHGGRQSRSNDYKTVLPGLHFRYQLTSAVLARLSWATNIGRPGIGQIVPVTMVNDDNDTITSGNPALKPEYADNFDFSLEYYFEPIGVLSAGVFLKEIRDFIFTQGGMIVGQGPDNGFDGLYEGYLLTSQINGGFSRMRGIELNYRQQFTFLPGWWKGFGAYANYTRMEIEGHYGDGDAIAIAPTSEVAGFIPEVANVGLSYIRRKSSIRLQYNYRGRYLDTYNTNQAQLLYRRAKATLDIKLRYHFSRHFDAYLDLNNALGESDRSLEYYRGEPQAQHDIGAQIFFGVNARL